MHRVYEYCDFESFKKVRKYTRRERWYIRSAAKSVNVWPKYISSMDRKVFKTRLSIIPQFPLWLLLIIWYTLRLLLAFPLDFIKHFAIRLGPLISTVLWFVFRSCPDYLSYLGMDASGKIWTTLKMAVENGIFKNFFAFNIGKTTTGGKLIIVFLVAFFVASIIYCACSPHTDENGEKLGNQMRDFASFIPYYWDNLKKLLTLYFIQEEVYHRNCEYAKIERMLNEMKVIDTM